MTRCHFHIEIYAPKGLSGIEPYLSDCQFPVKAHVSGFNGQVILRYIGDDDANFAMDPSSSKVLNASGSLDTDWAEAWRLLESLSLAIYLAGFPHRIGADDPATDRTFWLTHEYTDRGQAQHVFDS
jgi:hypothetical protein